MEKQVAKFVAEWIEFLGAFAIGMTILWLTGRL
jgi:hypothetical protein